MKRAAWIERAYVFGCTERPGRQSWQNQKVVPFAKLRECLDPLGTMPPPGPERLAEAIRRPCPTAKLARYEARDIAKDRAIRAIACQAIKKP